MYCTYGQCKSPWTNISLISFNLFSTGVIVIIFSYNLRLHISLLVFLIQFQYNFESFLQFFFAFINVWSDIHGAEKSNFGQQHIS